MNPVTSPPEHDLRPAVRNRQRDELIAIVQHESAGSPPRRRLVPLAAAASVIAVVGGLAFGVPALRGEEPSVAGDTAATKLPVSELPPLETKLLWGDCLLGTRPPGNTGRNVLPYTGGKAFKYTTPQPAGVPTKWFFTANGSYGTSLVCGVDVTGRVIERWPTSDADLRGSVSGRYVQPVARITYQATGQQPIEAELRDGFWFVPVSKKSGETGTVRAYDKAGELVRASVTEAPATKPR
ncbi:hypothetical protein [Kribbella sp. CA-293567]|uniref:hypothetical protein n=1 Tax=Kribbella sp. CA-293567 TaxID=3002436 RepID=UPI0022DE7FC3|nr:hypothetical protein [Kribbella sp. CA-293567]WBQ06683.1 hypothetical protein OX958_07775 [Kribbella sp. CA-293567]